jgi:hypothetical protein
MLRDIRGMPCCGGFGGYGGYGGYGALPTKAEIEAKIRAAIGLPGDPGEPVGICTPDMPKGTVCISLLNISIIGSALIALVKTAWETWAAECATGAVVGQGTAECTCAGDCITARANILAGIERGDFQPGLNQISHIAVRIAERTAARESRRTSPDPKPPFDPGADTDTGLSPFAIGAGLLGAGLLIAAMAGKKKSGGALSGHRRRRRR